MVRKLEPGRYTVTDITSGMALDFSGANNGTLHAWELYGGARQQVRTVVPLFSLGARGADGLSFLLSSMVITDCLRTHALRCIAYMHTIMCYYGLSVGFPPLWRRVHP